MMETVEEAVTKMRQHENPTIRDAVEKKPVSTTDSHIGIINMAIAI